VGRGGDGGGGGAFVKTKYEKKKLQPYFIGSDDNSFIYVFMLSTQVITLGGATVKGSGASGAINLKLTNTRMLPIIINRGHH